MSNDQKHLASDYESEGRRFESCRARPEKSCKSGTFLFIRRSFTPHYLSFDRNLTAIRVRRSLSGPF